MFDYSCEYCKKPFQSKSKNKKYWSISCSNRARSKSRMVACLNCKKMFRVYPSSNKKYCCHSCSAEHKKTKIQPKECIGCREKFTPKRLSSKTKYCSIKCFANNSDNHGFKKRKVGQKLYGYVCKSCGEEFKSRKRSRDYCSVDCMRKYKASPTFNKVCKYSGCSGEFSTKKEKQEYCSRQCHYNHKIELYKEKAIEKECPNCNNVYVVDDNKMGERKKYCSKKCHSESMTKKSNKRVCPTCESVFYTKRKNVFCSKSCANKGENNPMYGLKGELSPIYGRVPWTKGKTKHTDERIKDLGKKVSSVLRRKFANGEMSNAGENNGMYGKNHSKETKDQISVTRSDKIINGEYALWFKKGTVYSNKMNEEIVFRSSWEEACIKFFDGDNDVSSFEFEPLRIPYVDNSSGNIRNYIPDFIVSYSDGTKKMIEVKPSFFIDDPTNQAKFKAAREYCEKHNISFEVWTEAKINDIKESLPPIYS